jgi:RNA polymerase sigma-70 factor, ECF subfamily
LTDALLAPATRCARKSRDFADRQRSDGNSLSVAGDERFESALRAAQAGEHWGFEELYRGLHAYVLRYLRLQAPREAEDLAADTWMSVASALDRFSGDEGAFRSWVFTIARRRMVDYIRRSSRRPGDYRPMAEAQEGPAPDDTESTAMATVATEEALARISRLPPDQAEIVLLRVLGGLSADQVGAIVGKPAGTVRVLQHRALKRLAQDLTSERVTPPRGATTHRGRTWT